MPLMLIDRVRWSEEKINLENESELLTVTQLLKQLNKYLDAKKHTCDDRLIINFKNQGIHVRDKIDKTTQKVTKITNLVDKYKTS